MTPVLGSQFALRLSDAERDALFGTCERRESVELAGEVTPCRNDGLGPQRFNGTEESCTALGSCKIKSRRTSAFRTSTSSGTTTTATTYYYYESACMAEVARRDAPSGNKVPGSGPISRYLCRCEPVPFTTLMQTSYIGSDRLVQQLIDDAEACADLAPQSCQTGQTFSYTVTQSEVSSSSSGGSTLQTTAPQDTQAPEQQQTQAPQGTQGSAVATSTTPTAGAPSQQGSPTLAATPAPATTPAPTVTEFFTVVSQLSVTFDSALSDNQLLGAQRGIAESMGMTFPSPGLEITFQVAASASVRRLLATAYDVNVRYTTTSVDDSTAVKARLEDPAAPAMVSAALQTATGVAVSGVAVQSVAVQQVAVSAGTALGSAASLAISAVVGCALMVCALL
ncbi:unnamed protein product [Pedinophyceae sp. YPF-701]|nr:unnamed protein product [Pedinophyceae sp. YPF-701]